MTTRRRPVIGVMGRGEGSSPGDEQIAERLGELIAREQWVLLTGGRDAGIMTAAARGAKRVQGSLTIGVLPTPAEGTSPHVDVAIFTGMGDARNAINVLSSDVIVACGSLGAGTASEVALAIKAGRRVLLLGPPEDAAAFFMNLSPLVSRFATPEQVIASIRECVAELSGAKRQGPA